MTLRLEEALQLVDYRRRIAEIYAAVRASEDSYSSWILWRSGRDEIFRSHPQSPIPPDGREDFGGLSYFEYDPDFRLLAEVETLPPRSTHIRSSDDSHHVFDRIGKANFYFHGVAYSLSLYWLADYAGGLFVSYRDLTSGKETYGSCRYLLDTAKGSDLGTVNDRLILDFNFSYQPSCSYDPRWICPLAPLENHLPIAITAGERVAAR